MSKPVEAYRLMARMLALPEGLHAIRYESAADDRDPPFILLQPIPDDADAVEQTSSSEGHPGCLVRPGAVLVFRAKRPVMLVATTAATGTFGRETAVIKVEPLGPRRDQASLPLPTAELELVESAAFDASTKAAANPSSPPQAARQHPSAAGVGARTTAPLEIVEPAVHRRIEP